MELRNSFTIDVPVDTAWRVLNDPQAVAPCFPGAALTEYEGDRFAGTVKIKLGPISMLFRGRGTYVTRDEASRRVVIEATGRDSRGNGSATARVTGSMTPEGPARTLVTLVTDLKVTGRPAQLGRGVLNDVADRIIGQFAACVAETLAPAEPAPAAPPLRAAARSAEEELDLVGLLAGRLPAPTRTLAVLTALVLVVLTARAVRVRRAR